MGVRCLCVGVCVCVCVCVCVWCLFKCVCLANNCPRPSSTVHTATYGWLPHVPSLNFSNSMQIARFQIANCKLFSKVDGRTPACLGRLLSSKEEKDHNNSISANIINRAGHLF